MGRSGAVGVDFGTATTLLAERTSSGPASVVPLGRTTRALPSVARVDGADIVVGEDADDGRPGQFRSVKRAITERREHLVAYGPDGPHEVAADRVIVAILGEVVRRSRRQLAGGGPGPVRLGCPAQWDGPQRRRLLDLAAAAGLDVGGSALVDEPVAAGLAWLTDRYLRHGERPAGRLLVFDMGGGTLDIAVLAVVGGPRPEISVLASVGMSLAGDALDVAIAHDIAAEMAANRVDVAQHPHPELAWALLERAAREAKTRLSTGFEHPLVLPRPLGYVRPVRYRRDQLEEAFRTQMEGAEHLVVAALRTARLRTGGDARSAGRDALLADVDHVLLAGGMSRIPYVGARLSALFPAAAVYGGAGVPPDETVVAGLAEVAGVEGIGLHRPGFDLVLEWDLGRRQHTLYEAHTPLYEPWQVYNGRSELGYQRRVGHPDVPESGDGWLRVVSGAGRVVDLSLDGSPAGGLPVAFGPEGIELVVRCDGRVSLTDGLGAVTDVRAEVWPLNDGGGPLVLRSSLGSQGSSP